MVEPRKLRLSRPDDLIAAVPYLVGFTPTDSLLCIALDDKQVTYTARLDLPDPSEVHALAAPAEQTAAMLSRYGSTAILVGYGPAERVTPAATVITSALQAAHVNVRDVLAVHDGRYWCLCGDAGCAEGVAYNLADSLVPAEAVYLGIAPLPDRAALEQLIAPVTGPERDRIRAATYTALRRVIAMIDENDPAAHNALPEHVVSSGITAVRHAYESAARGETLSDDEVAWLSAVLMLPAVRDHAWAACDGSDDQRRLWIDVTRRSTPQTSTAPACLLAVTAYLAGDGAMANLAVDRALRADPDDRLAHLLDCALQTGLPPLLWKAATTD